MRLESPLKLGQELGMTTRLIRDCLQYGGDSRIVAHPAASMISSVSS
jgi:hypothetical protein